MTAFVPQYYRMDPETEEAIFGRDLKNGMVVLVEAPSRRADLNAFDPDSNPLRPDSLPEHVEFQALRYNRWAKVTRLEMITEGKDKVEQILFIAEYDDGLRATQKSYMTSGWLVKKDSIPEASGGQEVPNVVKWNGEGIAKKYCELMGLKMVADDGLVIYNPLTDPVTDKSINQILRDATRKKVGVAEFMEKQEKLTDFTTAASLKAAGYSNVAISQITRLTEKRVQEILERHAETPFLRGKTERNLLDDLESGRLRVEVDMHQTGRDVQAIIKPGPNYHIERNQ